MKGLAKLRILLLCAVLLLVLASCGAPSPLPRRTSIRIGVAMYDQYDTFIGEMMALVDDYAQQLEQEHGFTITILKAAADGSQVAQNNQVEEFIQAGCDVICVNLVDRTDVSVIIDKAEAAGLPIVFFNRELVPEDLNRNNRLFYVGAAALDSGRMQGEIVAQLCREDMARVDKNGDGVLQYVMLEGEAGHQDAVIRTEYSIKAVQEAGFGVERLGSEMANWVRPRAETKMTQWLETYGDRIEVVFANNDDMALGSIDALKRAKTPLEDWPVVVGIDGTGVGLAAVAAGEMAGTVYNDARGQAKGLMELSFALAANRELPTLSDGKYIRLPYRVITADQVQEFLGQAQEASPSR